VRGESGLGRAGVVRRGGCRDLCNRREMRLSLANGSRLPRTAQDSSVELSITIWESRNDFASTIARLCPGLAFGTRSS
jgi:hypothetical protein